MWVINDSGHRKSGNLTAGVGRQYIGEIGKTDNGVVVFTTHLHDGVKSLPLDIARTYAVPLYVVPKIIIFKILPLYIVPLRKS